MLMKKKASNQFQCPRCKEILTSTHNYDLQKCKCGALAIDDKAFDSIDWEAVSNHCSDYVNELEDDRKERIKRQKEKGSFSVKAGPGVAGKPKKRGGLFFFYEVCKI